MKIKEKYLPIGTVVLLKGGKKELMIIGYCILPDGAEGYDKNGKVDVSGKVFDYGACIYPEGMISSNQLYTFDHDQIEKICYRGYETDQQKEVSQALIKFREEYDKNNGNVEAA